MEEWLSSIGFPRNIELDGTIHRVCLGESRSKSGWYIGWSSPIVTVVAGNWKTGERWKYGAPVAEGSRHVVNAKVAAAKEEASRERKRRQELVAMRGEITLRSLPTTGSNAYLARKRVAAIGVYFEGPDLLVPVRDFQGKTWGYQRILPDGAKFFQPGGKVEGNYHELEGLSQTDAVFIAEGYATAATISMAMGGRYPVFCGYHAGNLRAVAIAASELGFKDIIVCGDEDLWTPGNPGRSKAELAAQAVGGRVVFPEFQSLEGKPTDFNDLHCREGLETVVRQLKKMNPQRPGRG